MHNENVALSSQFLYQTTQRRDKNFRRLPKCIKRTLPLSTSSFPHLRLSVQSSQYLAMNFSGVALLVFTFLVACGVLSSVKMPDRGNDTTLLNYVKELTEDLGILPADQNVRFTFDKGQINFHIFMILHETVHHRGKLPLKISKLR